MCLWFDLERWEPIYLYFLQQLHRGGGITQLLVQSNVLRLRRGKCDMHLKLATPDYRADGVQDDVASPGLDSSWIVAGGRAMSVFTKFGVNLHLKAIKTQGITLDPKVIKSLEV